MKRQRETRIVNETETREYMPVQKGSAFLLRIPPQMPESVYVNCPEIYFLQSV
jgi:hypothetical protein